MFFGAALIFLFCNFFWISLCSASGGRERRTFHDPLLVRKTSAGLIRGRSITVVPNGAKAYSFFGIPYARQPTSPSDRFQPRGDPLLPWPGVRDATEYGPSCFFNSSFVYDDITPMPMDEDCLLVNVFTSERCLLQGGCPVFQYIYGGQFMFGSTRKLDPQTIAENFCAPGRDLVVVTVGYRMNIFGLLNLNHHFHDTNPPNTAIHDIVQSLQWTQREIANFGGDPGRVTLGGESSGSVATQILSVCPRANFLFHQTISMSGPGTIEMLPKNRNERSSRRMALMIGCISEVQWKSDEFWAGRVNVFDVMRCLEAIPAQRLNAALRPLEAEGLFFHGLATETGPNGIITDTFHNLILKNPPNRPMLTGTVSKEFKDAFNVTVNPQTGRVNRLRLWLYCRRLIRQLNYERGEAALAECLREYDDVGRVTFLFEDVNYFVPHFSFAAVNARHGAPTFLYQFEYEGIGNAYRAAPGRSVAFSLLGTAPEKTPHHVQDLVYLFGQNRGIFTAKDHRLQRLHSALFANFIANGTPNGAEITNARPFRPELHNYYRIDFADQQNWAELAGDTPGYHARAVHFWNIRMAKVGGRAHMLSDEALIDDQMMSEYMARDLAAFADTLANSHLMKAEEQSVLWHQLFCFSMLICLLVTVLLSIVVTWLWVAKRRRRRYRRADYTELY